MNNVDAEKDLVRIQDTCARLREHYDSVQIFATKFNGKGETFHFTWGEGCTFSRHGQISLYLEREKELERIRVRNQFGDSR